MKRLAALLAVVVATAADCCAAFAEAGSVVTTLNDAWAASGTASAVPVADTLTVLARSPDATTVVDGVHALTRRAAAAARVARAMTG